ncbi:MAG: hypothetical protein A2W85_12175 [Bacteroidetes bacterium GWF2_41_31]|nr:MAG: hypothetical protein A2W85_12175 [Bacteroidetes bacterium GWF2_41_31]
MKNTIAIFAFIAILASSSFAANDNTGTPAATTTISGQVFDKATGEALAGVKIILDENATEVYTDFDGNFTISEIASGSHEITTELISYKSEQKSIEVSPTLNTIKVEIGIDNN